MLDQLRRHRATLTELRQSQREVLADDMSPGLRITWQIYAIILEDAISTLNSLINYLTQSKEKTARK
jgi:hypothetical protein